MSDLRAACDHGRYEIHGVETTRTPLPDGGVEVSNLCDGYRVVTIDYEAAYDEATTMRVLPLSPGKVRKIVAAAIGDTDD